MPFSFPLSPACSFPLLESSLPDQTPAVYTLTHLYSNLYSLAHPEILSPVAATAYANIVLAACAAQKVSVTFGPPSPQILLEIASGPLQEVPARASETEIYLPSWACRPIFILHEVAHVILLQARLNDGHGIRFTRVFLDLLSACLCLPEASLATLAREMGILVAPRYPIPIELLNLTALNLPAATS